MIRIVEHTQVGRILARKAARFTEAEQIVAPPAGQPGASVPADVMIAAGVESMSVVPLMGYHPSFNAGIFRDENIGMAYGMGLTAERVAQQWKISREEQDAFAADSQCKALAAIEAGYFKSQIVPVEIKSRKSVVNFDTDEHPKADTTVESLAALRPAFVKENGTVTAGNASGLNDGAAACVLMEASAASKANLRPLARLVSYAVAGVDPSIMGTGPIPAVKLALQRAGLKLDDMDVVESNEAFAAQACAVTKELGLDPAKVNPNGSGISLGHPIGATGALITVKALHELQRVKGKYALVTMCIGGGQGIAAIFERL